MSKIAFFCIPAHGHTNPTLAVIEELNRRGHQVRYYTTEQFREKVETAGAEFVSIDLDEGKQMAPAAGAKAATDLKFAANLIVDTTLAIDQWICREMASYKPDIIVADSMAYWGKLIAQKLNIPYMCSTTTFAFNQYSARVMKQGPGNMLQMLGDMPAINRSLQKLRDKGYPCRGILDIISNDNYTNTIVYTSPEFQPCAESFSRHYHFVGPLLRPAVSQVHKEPDKNLIYISLGTVNNAMLDFYRNCLTALGNDPRYQVIMSVGCQVDIQSLGQLPANFQVAPNVDQVAVLQAADVFLTHCGMNSASEGLYCGVPLLLYPLTKEQQGVANRISQLGAGIMLKDSQPAAIRAGVEQLLAQSGFREQAAVLAASFRRCGGAEEAADAIEKTAAEPPEKCWGKKPPAIWTAALIGQCVTGTIALILLALAIFSQDNRLIFLISGAVLGTVSNIIKLVDTRKQKQKMAARKKELMK